LIFHMNNVGPLQDATIDVNGIAVIAGENDTGKSTAGKMIYAVVRAFTRYDQEFKEDLVNFLDERIESIYFQVRNLGNTRGKEVPTRVRVLEMMDRLSVYTKEDRHMELLEFTTDFMKEIQTLYSPAKIPAKIKMAFEEMQQMIQMPSNAEEVKRHALQKAIAYEFNDQVSTIPGGARLSFRAAEGTGDVLRFDIDNNRVVDLEVKGDDLAYRSVVYVESPYVLQLENLERSVRRPMLTNTLWASRKSALPLHVSDLMNYLRNSKSGEYSITESLSNEVMNTRSQIDESITRLIDGDFYYDRSVRQFMYKKAHEGIDEPFQSQNTATGIKSIGILKLLLNSGLIREHSLLILDEPEVNLNPKWQIEYAKLLVSLAQAMQVHIITTSHSPYFIEAVKVYSDRLQFSSSTKFYLASKIPGVGLSRIDDVTDHLDVIFDSLAAPFMTLESDAGKEGS